jgi:hypothetical protein
MKREVITFVLGFVLGTSAASAAVHAAEIFGGDGQLRGWEVVFTEKGETVEVCRDPHVWAETQEIECR